MSRTAVFIDLANLYSNLLNTGSTDQERKSLRDYFLYWLDFDLLAAQLIGEAQQVSVWVFYSGQRIGPSNERISDKYLSEYIDRINSLPGVTARDANIEGTQREHIKVSCENCGHETVTEYLSEKGVDASLTVQLFDTMDAWDTAFLLSGDADFVPAVVSLRRRGKIIIGGGFSNASSALVRECFDYIDLNKKYIDDDFSAYELFKQGGPIRAWLEDALYISTENENVKDVELRIDWVIRRGTTPIVPHIYLYSKNPINLESRQQAIYDYLNKHPDRKAILNPLKQNFSIQVGQAAILSVTRGFETLRKLHQGLNARYSLEEKLEQSIFEISYKYNSETNTYLPIRE